MTLNIAHGRGDSINQLLLSEKAIRSNLEEIAQLIQRSDADVVALQEADGPSWWSGGFDHVQLLAGKTGYPWHYRARHASSWLFDYGTALLSQVAWTQVKVHAFAPTPPTASKGFLFAQLAWHPSALSSTPVAIDVVSVHLDFSRDSVRRAQIKDLAEFLSERHNPLIILGDFNSEWLGDESVVQILARTVGLHTYMPAATDLGTYNSGQSRLDWILISEQLQFDSYTVLSDVVSDHFAVVADVSFVHPFQRSNSGREVPTRP